MKVRVLVDGRSEEMDLPKGLTVASLLDRLGLERERYWVARERTMVRKGDYAEALLREGDTVEIFRILSGG